MLESAVLILRRRELQLVDAEPKVGGNERGFEREGALERVGCRVHAVTFLTDALVVGLDR